MAALHNRRDMLPLRRDLRRHATPTERRMWTVLRGRRLGGWKFTRQHSVGSYVVDFYCAAGRLVIELDGPVHDRRREDDAERDGFLRAAGLRVLRFANPDIIGQPDHVRRTILDLLDGDCPAPRPVRPDRGGAPAPVCDDPPAPLFEGGR